MGHLGEGKREGGGVGHHGEVKRGTQGVDLGRKRESGGLGVSGR